MATLKDVAAEAGLTVTTVSRVLNNRGYISEETREKVHAAMKKLNYRPNELARSLSKQSSNTIGVIVPHISHPYFAEMISNIENAASKKGYKILLCNSKGTDQKTREYLEMCTSNRVAAIILFSAGVSVEEFSGSNIPLITVERFLENGTASIECDNLQGGELAAMHLIEKGCSRLLHISGVSESSMPADERAEGFMQICDKRGITHYEVTTNQEQYDREEYYELLEHTLETYPDVDGIFASSDVIAAQTIQVCTRMGIRVPQDVRIVGFDDTRLAALMQPQLTTIHQPIKEMATEAVTLALNAVEGKVIAKRTLLPVTLVERETT